MKIVLNHYKCNKTFSENVKEGKKLEIVGMMYPWYLLLTDAVSQENTHGGVVP